MKTNNLFDTTEPSDALVEQVLERSAYFNDFIESLPDLKEKIERTKDNKALLRLNKKMTLTLKKCEKLKECTWHLLDLFKTIPLLSERLEKAGKCFYQGKFLEIDEALDAEEIRAEIQALEEERPLASGERKEDIETLLEYRSYELVVKALHSYTLIENEQWHESVYNLLQDAYDASYNVISYYEFGYYLSLTDEHEWATDVLMDAHVAAREDEAYSLYDAKCLWAMGLAAKRAKDYKLAAEHTGKALKIYTRLAGKNPVEYSPRMSNMLVVMGNDHVFMNNFSVALVVFEEALRIRREFPARGSAYEHAMNIANVLDKLAYVHISLKEYPEAISRLEESLRIQDSVMEDNVYQTLESKADTLHLLMGAHLAAGEFDKALRQGNEEVKVRERVREIDPFGQLARIAEVRALLGDLYARFNRVDNITVEREKVVKLYKILAEHFPKDNWLPVLGEKLNHCSNLYFHRKMYGKYFRTMEEAMKVFRELALVDPDEYLATVGCLLANYCHYYSEIAPDKKKAREAANEAYEILEATVDRSDVAEFAYNKMKEILGK